MVAQVTGNAVVDIYARISRAGDKRQRSIAGQVADCKAVLSERGLELGVVHDQDDGRSAWSPSVRRAGWEAMMTRLRTGEAGGVIVFDLARFSRRPIEGERLIEEAERGLLILDSESEYDLTSPNGKKQFRDQLSGAAYESDRLSTRVKRGKRIKAMNGEPNGRPRAFGFETFPRTDSEGKRISDGIGPHPAESVILQEMTERFLAGEKQARIIDDLNERQILTSYGKPWTRAGFRQVLSRPINAGLVMHNGTVVAKLPFLPIISEADHAEVLARYAAGKRGRPPSPAYLASGFTVCGLCGTNLNGRPRSNVRPYPDGEPNRQYHCAKTHGGCGRVAADQRALDRAVGELVIITLSDAGQSAKIEAEAAETRAEAAALDQAIADIEALAIQLAERLGNEQIDLARFDAATGPLDARLAKLRDKRSTLEVSESRAIPADSEAAWRARWQAAEPAERRDLVRLALRGRKLALAPADPKDRNNMAKRLSVRQ